MVLECSVTVSLCSKLVSLYKAKMIAAVQKLLEVDVIRQGDKAILNWISSDYIFNIVPYVFNLALANPNDQQAVQDLQLLSGFLRVCTRYNVGNKDILKPDGTGFHHNAHYNGYMYSYKTWVEYFYRFKGTSFKIDPKSYERLKKAVVTIYMTAVRAEGDKNRIYANSMAGRHPFYSIEVPFTQKLFEQLIEIGADATGTDLDKELAAYYNYFFKTDKYPVPAADANGFYQYNYSSAGVYRQPGWVAVMKSPTAMLWGSEIYNKTNRFGRYQSHGTLEILYDGGLVPTGYPSNNENKGAGWDWNMMPGSTTVHYTNWAEMMPYKNDKDRFDQKARKSNFAGAVSMKDYGLFATAFDQDDRWGSQRFTPTNLTFCKSVLAIDGMLFSIGNGISAKGDYADNMITATNLFQSVVSKQYNKLTVNGQEVTKGNRQNYASSEPVTMINPVSTGFFVPAGHDELTVIYDEQETPSSVGMAGKPAKEVVAKAYMNHGVKPEKKSYSFVVVPAADEAKMKDVADRQTKGELFSVVEMQDSLHDAISDRCHRKFADTEVQVTSSSVLLGEVARILHVGLVGRCQVSRTAKQVRQNILDVVDQASGDRTACFRFLLFCPESGVIFQRLARLCIVILVPERFHLRIFLAVSGKHHVPCSFYLCLLLCDLGVVFVYLFRYEERLFARPV